MVLFFLFIHIVLLVVVMVLWITRRIHMNATMLPIVVFIPIWGALAVAVENFLRMRGRAGTEGQNLEAMRGDLVEKGTMPTPEDEGGGTVPLEDALLIDNAGMKRSVMMDVLMQDTKNYIPVLNEARMNDDVEVVHYATTAMVELSKEFELKIQEYATLYSENPNRPGLLEEYKDFLQQYIYSGMVEGQMLEIHRTTYQQLLRECIQRNGKKQDYFDLIESLFQIKEYSQIQGYLDYMDRNWPTDETLWKYHFRYYYENGNKEGVQRLIADVKKEGNFYSKDIRQIVAFWEEKQDEKMEA